MVAVEFARFFGLPAPARANLTDVTNAVCATAAHTRVDLVLVDEIHNISLATRDIPKMGFPFIVYAYLRSRAKRKPFLCPECGDAVQAD